MINNQLFYLVLANAFVCLHFPHLQRAIVPRIMWLYAVKFDTSTVFGRGMFIQELHPLLPTRTAAEIKFGEIFVPVQSMGVERNFYPVKILCYTVYIDGDILPLCLCNYNLLNIMRGHKYTHKNYTSMIPSRVFTNNYCTLTTSSLVMESTCYIVSASGV